MGNLDDANVDKDLLNQIFADGDGADGANVDKDLLDQIFNENQEILDENATDSMVDNAASDITEAASEMPESEENIYAESVEPVAEINEEELLKEFMESPDVTAETQEEISSESYEPGDVEQTADTYTEPAVDETAEASPEVDTESVDYVPEATVSGFNGDALVETEAREMMDKEKEKGSLTIITENTTINGSISSDGSLEVMGTISGDIACLGKVYISGNVSGDVVAAEIYINTPRLVGGIDSEGTVKIGDGTIVVGDVSGSSAYIAGAVKGNIDVEGPVVIESTAIVKGDIKAKSITINSGAVVDGYCSINYAGVDLDQFFA